MASKSTQQLCDIATCPICLETLKIPKMLQCYHFFCHKCLLQTKRDPGSGHFICSMCRKTTALGDITTVPIMNGLLEAIEMAKTNESPCVMCKTELPEYRCLDCKSLYCPGCKTNHDAIPTCAKHRCVKLDSNEANIYIDKLVFCKHHPDKVVELNCIKCNDLICVLCKAVDHNDHQVEIISNALKRMLPQVQRNKELLQKHAQNCEQRKNELKMKSEEIGTCIDEQKIKANSKLETVIATAKTDHTKVISDLELMKKTDICAIDKSIQAMEDKSRSINDSITWTDNILATAHSTSLLQELQTGPSRRLLSIEKKMDYPELLEPSLFKADRLELEPTRDNKQNVIGTIHQSMYSYSNSSREKRKGERW